METWRRFVALGDSLTEGVGDPAADGTLRGWADRLAEALAGEGFEYHNLARLGARTSDVRRRQLPRALALRPDLASVLTGMNDVLRPGLDPGSLRDDLAAIAGGLKDQGAFVFTACLPDSAPGLRLLPKRLRQPLETRLALVNDVIRAVADEMDVLCLDMDDLPGGFRLAISSIDGLHPNAHGHLLMARAAAQRLSAYCGRPIRVVDDRLSWVTTSVRHLRWLASAGYLRHNPWVRLARDRLGDTHAL